MYLVPLYRVNGLSRVRVFGIYGGVDRVAGNGLDLRCPAGKDVIPLLVGLHGRRYGAGRYIAVVPWVGLDVRAVCVEEGDEVLLFSEVRRNGYILFEGDHAVVFGTTVRPAGEVIVLVRCSDEGHDGTVVIGTVDLLGVHCTAGSRIDGDGHAFVLEVGDNGGVGSNGDDTCCLFVTVRPLYELCALFRGSGEGEFVAFGISAADLTHFA